MTTDQTQGYRSAPGERWRVGRKVRKNLYAETPDGVGRDIGRMDSPELAAFACDAVNAYLDKQQATEGER